MAMEGPSSYSHRWEARTSRVMRTLAISTDVVVDGVQAAVRITLVRATVQRNGAWGPTCAYIGCLLLWVVGCGDGIVMV
jgi:hypothetical protein